jgi:hypothetical protein
MWFRSTVAVTELDRTDNDILLLNSDVATTRGVLEELSAVVIFAATALFYGRRCSPFKTFFGKALRRG